jgi:hypothetical protein
MTPQWQYTGLLAKALAQRVMPTHQVTPQWQYTVTYRKFEPKDDWDGLQADMDLQAMDGWEMVNACWKPASSKTNMMATIFWRRCVPATSTDE